MFKTHLRSRSILLLIGRMWLGYSLMACPAILVAQDSYTKVYEATYRLAAEQDRLDVRGNIIQQKDSVYLQSDEAAMDDRLIRIASVRGLPASVKFGAGKESNRLFVNPYPVYEDGEASQANPDAVYYYQLHNRQSIKLRFRDFSIKAISVPLKVRFGREDVEFSTDANLGAFAGFSWGRTKFTHKKKTGNTETETKWTIGLLVGTENLTFEFQNENEETVEEQTALLSTGVGFVYSYEKFTAGITTGFDFGLGANRVNWAYHARPWLGVAIGYSLFSF